MTSALPGVLVFATAILSAAVIEAVRRVGSQSLLDIPNARSSHRDPTRRGGGLGVAVGVFVVWMVGTWSTGQLAHDVSEALLATVTAVGLVSWLDDLRGVRFSVRLLVHTLAAIVILLDVGTFQVVGIPRLTEIPLSWCGWVLGILWVVGLTNAYNFMDGIDGIAGGQGVVAGLAWWALGSIAGAPAAALLGLLIAVACGVFLMFNWQPARIFMGDVGSAPLGFTFASLPLLAAHEASMAVSWVAVAGTAVVWPFIFDASFTFLWRLRRHENVFAAHRSHLYQRMVISGWSHRRVSSLYILAAVVTSGAGIAVAAGLPWSGALAITVAAGTGLGLWGLTVRLERLARAG